MVQAIFFDLFETLVTEWINGKKEKSHVIAGFDMEESLFKKEWRLRQERRMDGTFSTYQSVLVDIFKTYNLPIDKEQIDFAYQERKRVKSLPFKNMNEEILQTLSDLKKRGMQLGLISNCTPEEVES